MEERVKRNTGWALTVQDWKLRGARRKGEELVTVETTAREGERERESA